MRPSSIALSCRHRRSRCRASSYAPTGFGVFRPISALRSGLSAWLDARWEQTSYCGAKGTNMQLRQRISLARPHSEAVAAVSLLLCQALSAPVGRSAPPPPHVDAIVGQDGKGMGVVVRERAVAVRVHGRENVAGERRDRRGHGPVLGGDEPAPLHVLPTPWNRNAWTLWPSTARPSMAGMKKAIAATHPELGDRWLHIESDAPLLFCARPRRMPAGVRTYRALPK
jgi:hypothetical protein